MDCLYFAGGISVRETGREMIETAGHPLPRFSSVPGPPPLLGSQYKFCPGCLLSCLPPSLRLGGGTHGQCPLPREGVRHAPGTEGHCPQRCESESPQEVLPSGKLGVSSWPGGESYNGIQPCSADTPAFTGAMGTGWGQMALGAAQPQFCPLLWPLPATGLRQVSQHLWPQLVAW